MKFVATEFPETILEMGFVSEFFLFFFVSFSIITTLFVFVFPPFLADAGNLPAVYLFSLQSLG